MQSGGIDSDEGPVAEGKAQDVDPQLGPVAGKSQPDPSPALTASDAKPTYDDAAYGVPIYPGASQVEGARGMERDGDTVRYRFVTPDLGSVVAQYYESMLESPSSSIRDGKGTVVGDAPKHRFKVDIGSESVEVDGKKTPQTTITVEITPKS